MANPHAAPFPEKFMKVIDNIQRLDERGVLYYLDYTENYYELQDYVSMLTAKPGCSTFVHKNKDDEYFMGRNYDFSHYRFADRSNLDDVTGLNIVVRGNNPMARYKSIGIADGYWMDAFRGSMFEGVLDDGKTDISAAAFLPFLCMDGLNEKGLAVSIMWLPTEVEWTEVDYVSPETVDPKDKDTTFIYEEAGKVPQKLEYKAKNGSLAINTVDRKTWKANTNFAVHQNDPDKKTVYHPVLMRMMLDNCASVDEALYLTSQVNVQSAMTDSDYHILVADKSGKSVVLEWVNDQLNIVETNHATNYFISREDHYGAGYERDDLLVSTLKKFKDCMSAKAAKHALALVSQDRHENKDVGFTQWSAIYNFVQGTLKLYVHMDYDKCYEYKI